MSDPELSLVRKQPADERLRPRWIADLLRLADKLAAYDLTGKGDWRCFGGVPSVLTQRIVPLFSEAFDLVNSAICGPVLKEACERVTQVTGRSLPFLIAQIGDVIEKGGLLPNELMKTARQAGEVLAIVSDDLLRRQSPLVVLDVQPDATPSANRQQPKPRMKREVAEPLIAQHLQRKPHDTAKEVTEAIGCSVGVTAESRAWRLNQRRLRIAKKENTDPKAVRLDEKNVNEAGGNRRTQQHSAREQFAEAADEIDTRDKELFHQIGEYEKSHPDATKEEVAAALGCTASDMERRDGMIKYLAAQQAESALEDTDTETPTTKSGTHRKWVEKQA